MPAPIFSLKFVHNAIAAELRFFQEESSDAQSVAELLEAYDFFCELMHFHHKGEETVVFPILDKRAPGYAATYLFDHREEIAHLDSLGRQMRAARDGGAFDLGSFQQELSAVVNAALTHIDKENTLILPELAARFSPPEQGELVGKVLGVIPKEKMPALIPWIVVRQSDEDAEAYLRAMMAGMPAPVFAAAKGWIQVGIAEERWGELCRRLPELSA